MKAYLADDCSGSIFETDKNEKEVFEGFTWLVLTRWDRENLYTFVCLDGEPTQEQLSAFVRHRKMRFSTPVKTGDNTWEDVNIGMTEEEQDEEGL